MTRSLSKATARRTVISTLAALLLAAAIPQAGFADTSDAGIWKIDPAKSKFSSGFATLSVQRTAGVKPAAGSFIVISKGNVYRVTGEAANDSNGIKPFDYTDMTAGQAVLIGTNAHSGDHCRLRCQTGLIDRGPTTLSFKALDGAGQQINDMLASDGQPR